LFDLTGNFDWHTKECTIWKQHKGRYNNMVEYNGLLIPETCSIAGQYTNGTINLTKISSDSDLAQQQPVEFIETESEKEERLAKESAARQVN
jgi:hypothetical protein